MNEWSQVILVVAVGVVFALALAIVAYALLVSNKRMAEQGRDLLKAVLAHSDNPKVVGLAATMEGTDRAAAVAGQPQPFSTPATPRGYPRSGMPREVGS